MKLADTLRSPTEASSAVKKAHCQAHLIPAAMALSASERAELLRLRKDNKKLQWSGIFGAIGAIVSFA